MTKIPEYIYNKTVSVRHRLHELAELSLQETRTKAYLMEEMKKLSVFEVVDKGSWFYAFYNCGVKGAENIAFRADFDALPIKEDINLSYHSENPEVSHRCGHDGHAAALVGLASVINDFGACNNVYLIFQHAEEIGAGGEECAKLIEEKNINRVYAYHNWSGYKENALVIKDGAFMCASKGVTYKFIGKESHASKPEDGNNPAFIIAKSLLNIKSIAEENIYKGMVMATVVNVQLGSKNFGINAGEGEISLTLRAEFTEDLILLEKKIYNEISRLSENGGIRFTNEETDVFPATVNNSNAVRTVKEKAERLGLDILDMKDPVRSSEDFGYYLQKTEGAMFYIGNGENYHQIHTTEYDFNDEILHTVISLFYSLTDN